MRTKALILAAQPPFEGPWVPIDANLEWASLVECRPPVAAINGQLKLEAIEDEGGSVQVFKHDEHITGKKYVRAVVGPIEDIEIISVYVEEVRC